MGMRLLQFRFTTFADQLTIVEWVIYNVLFLFKFLFSSDIRAGGRVADAVVFGNCIGMINVEFLRNGGGSAATSGNRHLPPKFVFDPFSLD